MRFTMLETAEEPEFVILEEMEKLKCCVCKQVLRIPMQTSCGHRICKMCVETLFKDKTGSVICPAAEEDCCPLIESEILNDYGGIRELGRLKVYCTFKEF